MDVLPADWTTLCVVVFALGLRHGLDADHLAAIDALTRLQWQGGRRGARWCGALFAAGHGAIVLAVAAATGALRDRWNVPPAFDQAGAWISIGVLLLLGVANLRALLAAPRGMPVAPVGLRTRWLANLMHAPGAAGVGALFALSFDTLGQAALFGVASAHFGGVGPALVLGALFVVGMSIVDGANGLWVARLLAGRANGAAALSRALGWAVTGLSLGVAAWSTARLLQPSGFAAQAATALAIVAACWWVADRLAARAPRLVARAPASVREASA